MALILKELRQRQEALATAAQNKYNEITPDLDETRTAEIETEFDAIMVDFDALTPQIERATRMAAVEGQLIEAAQQRTAANRPELGNGSVGAGAGDDVPMSYRQAFYEMVCAGGLVAECSPEVRTALKAGIVRDGFEQRAQSAGTTTAGGFTVPDEMMLEIVKSMVAWGPLYSDDVARSIITSGGNTIPIPTVDDTAVTAGAHTEGAALTDDGGKDVTFAQKSLGAYVFDTEFVKWSMELAQDSMFNMEILLGELLGERLGRIANAQLTNGTGSGAPAGIVVGSTLGTTTAGAAAITGDEIIDLEHSVNSAHRRAPSCGFMFSDNVLKAVRKLKDGNGNYLWNKGDVQKGVPASYNGYSFHVNDDMDSLATAKKTMLFGDMKKFYVRKVGAPVIGVMRERFWPDLGIAGLVRFDSVLSDTAAVKHMLQA